MRSARAQVRTSQAGLEHVPIHWSHMAGSSLPATSYVYSFTLGLLQALLSARAKSRLPHCHGLALASRAAGDIIDAITSPLWSCASARTRIWRWWNRYVHVFLWCRSWPGSNSWPDAS